MVLNHSKLLPVLPLDKSGTFYMVSLLIRQAKMMSTVRGTAKP